MHISNTAPSLILLLTSILNGCSASTFSSLLYHEDPEIAEQMAIDDSKSMLGGKRIVLLGDSSKTKLAAFIIGADKEGQLDGRQTCFKPSDDVERPCHEFGHMFNNESLPFVQVHDTLDFTPQSINDTFIYLRDELRWAHHIFVAVGSQDADLNVTFSRLKLMLERFGPSIFKNVLIVDTNRTRKVQITRDEVEFILKVSHLSHSLLHLNFTISAQFLDQSRDLAAARLAYSLSQGTRKPALFANGLPFQNLDEYESLVMSNEIELAATIVKDMKFLEASNVTDEKTLFHQLHLKYEKILHDQNSEEMKLYCRVNMCLPTSFKFCVGLMAMIFTCLTVFLVYKWNTVKKIESEKQDEVFTINIATKAETSKGEMYDLKWKQNEVNHV